MTVTEVMDSLRCRYRAPAWAFFEEVRDATGFGASRSADAIAFGLWPSQGLELHGFEVKAYRGDWLRELKRPEKADAVLGYCDRIWIVTSERSMVKLDELPPLWGLMEPHGDGLRATRTAERNPAAKPLDRRLFASLMRQAQRYVENEIKNGDGSKEAYARGLKEGKSSAEQGLETMRHDSERLQNAVDRFEKESGVRISSWDYGHIGETVKTVLSMKDMNFHARLSRLKEDIDTALENLNAREAVNETT